MFEIRLRQLTISGIGLDDLLHRRNIDIHAIACSGPQIAVWQHPQPYNARKRAETKGESLYSRIHKSLDRLAIDSITVNGGDLTMHSGEGTRSFRELGLRFAGILIDSAAAADPSRFFFAKEASLRAGAVTFPAGKGSMYDMEFAGLHVDASARSLVLQGFSMHPHGGSAAFLSKQKTQTEVYEIGARTITLSGTDWWALANGRLILADRAKAAGVNAHIFLDKRLPKGASTKRDNFPQQLLMQASVPISIRHLELRDARVVYEEYNQQSEERASISFDAISSEAEGITNKPDEVAKEPLLRFKGSCRFMNTTPMNAVFSFLLPKEKKGAFSADLSMGAMSYETVNPFSAALGLVRFSGGQLQEAHAHIEGNNDNLHGTLAAAYTGLHIEPLKEKKDEEGNLKKKKVTAKVANILLVKNNNPAKGGNLRRPEFSLDRTTEPNFFNFTWTALKAGLLKTIGVPLSMGMK